MTTQRTKPLIRWAGGKSRLLKHLLPLPEHTAYIEPFAGGLAVLLAKSRSTVEVVNDLNGDLVTLYRCVQFHPEALIQELQWTLNSRRNLQDFLAQPGLTDLQRSARWLVRNKIGFGTSMTSYGVSRTSGGAATGSRENVQQAIRDLSARLDKVSVENLSYERMLRLYDAPGTLFFMDPPYYQSKADCYDGWNEAQMSKFAAQVQQLKGDWIVTVDDSDLNRRLFQGWHTTAVKTRNGALNQAQAKGKQTFGEIIIRKTPAPATSERTKLLQLATACTV